LSEKIFRKNSCPPEILENTVLQKHAVFSLCTRHKKDFSIFISGLPEKNWGAGQNDPKKCGKDF
jgi:hypothetical protein